MTTVLTCHNCVPLRVTHWMWILWHITASSSVKSSNIELLYFSAGVFSSPGAKLISLENWLYHSSPHSPILSACLSKFSCYCSALSTNPISYRKQMELSLILACHLRRGQGEGKQWVLWGLWLGAIDDTWHANFSSLQMRSFDIKVNHQQKMTWRLY